MANRGTPRVHVPELDIEGAAGDGTVPTTADEFVNFFTSHVDTRGGGIGPNARIMAPLPLWTHYEYGEFSFRVDLVSGDPTAGVLQIWGYMPDGNVVLVAQTELDAGNQFPPVETLIDPGMIYSVILAGSAGTFEANILVFVRAYNKDE